MIGFLTIYDETEKSAPKEKVSFVHIVSESEEDVFVEMSEAALSLARKFDVKKVYLFYGKDKKIIYDYSL